MWWRSSCGRRRGCAVLLLGVNAWVVGWGGDEHVILFMRAIYAWHGVTPSNDEW